MMGFPLFSLSRAARAVALAAVFLLVGLEITAFAANPKPVGSVVISAKQVSFIFGGQGGGGTLYFGGRSYPFKIGGLGVGGLGISKFEAAGEVYKLARASDFFGSYFSARVGWAVGDVGHGQMWLENDKGVVLHLKARRQGLMLSMGADAIRISPR